MLAFSASDGPLLSLDLPSTFQKKLWLLWPPPVGDSGRMSINTGSQQHSPAWRQAHISNSTEGPSSFEEKTKVVPGPTEKKRYAHKGDGAVFSLPWLRTGVAMSEGILSVPAALTRDTRSRSFSSGCLDTASFTPLTYTA